MCLNDLSNLKIREKLAKENAESSKTEKRRLRKIFKELSSRCMLPNSGIDKEQFLRLTSLPGLLGEQVFAALDEDDDKVLDVKEFINGIVNLYKGDLETISETIFRIFDFNKNGYIASQDVLYILKYLPKECSKCRKSLRVNWNYQEKVAEFFSQRDFVRAEEFEDILKDCLEIPELVLQSVFNSLPLVFDQAMLPQRLITYSSDSVEFEGSLSFNERTYKFLLKNQSLYYFQKENSEVPAGIILVMDLFVEKKDSLCFQLKNSRFNYEFFTQDEVETDKWIKKIKEANKYKEIQDDYKLEHVLGEGAYGKVMLGENLYTGKKVAVKIISKEPLDKRSETRLWREISILGMCKHPNLLELEEVYETATKLYIVTKYVSGGSLFQYLKENNFKVSESFSKKIILDIATALGFLHSFGIIHRDIKLENVLVEIKHNKVKAKIIDFGLSCILGPSQNSCEQVGTLKYASPELISRIPYRESVDVWGLGVIAYILLAGRMPFYGKTDQEIATRILKKPIEFEGEKWNHVSEGAKHILKMLLTRRPAQRMKLNELLSEPWLTDLKESDPTGLPTSSISPNPFLGK